MYKITCLNNINIKNKENRGNHSLNLENGHYNTIMDVKQCSLEFSNASFSNVKIYLTRNIFILKHRIRQPIEETSVDTVTIVVILLLSKINLSNNINMNVIEYHKLSTFIRLIYV